MKLQITGASNFVNRMFEACGPYQWAREFLTNSIEANATKVEFGIEWQAVEKLGVYRRTIADDGIGMDSKELYRFFSILGEGAKKIGGIHEHFGVGAKIASLPWNPEGLVVISYKEGRGSMIWILLDPDSGDFELMEFDIDGEKSCVIEPQLIDEIDWSAVRPHWLKSHGTVVVLLGSEDNRDTVVGNPASGEKSIKGLSIYLNSRFWNLTDRDVKVAELRSERKSQWPQSSDDKDDTRRPNNRQIKGAEFYLKSVAAPRGKLQDCGTAMLDDERVLLDWYLWDGERPQIHMYAKESGYIAIRYNGELFQVTSNKAHFRWFGIIESKVQQNLSLILEPQHFQPRAGHWGIHPDQSRNRLIFTGNGEKGVDVPLSDWGGEFVEGLPSPILEAIHRARGELNGSISDEDYRKRLQDKFGKRWTIKVLVQPRKFESDTVPSTLTNEQVEVVNAEGRRRRHRKTIKIVRHRAIPGGDTTGVERDTPVDVPRFRFARADEFEKPWHLALWAPNDPDGPSVLINTDSSILQEVIEYHRGQYPDIYAEEVSKTVQQVFGEVATCKVAHSQKLCKNVTAEELDRDYRNEAALTIALMGLLAEESLIAQRLGKLGRKKVTAAITIEAA
jgi:hypothetical protein